MYFSKKKYLENLFENSGKVRELISRSRLVDTILMLEDEIRSPTFSCQNSESRRK